MTARTKTTDVDTVIVGFGLAGATLAWRLHNAGQSVLVIDPGDPVTSSRIAAGLITPITGKQLTLSATYDAEYASAVAFYRSIEAMTGQTILTNRTAIRVFASDAERTKWMARLANPQYATHSAPLPSHAALGADQAFAMRAAQVDTSAYLDATELRVPVLRARVDWPRDVSIDADGVSVLGRRAQCIVSAEGFAAQRNPYFSWVPFRAAKGEILTLRLPPDQPTDTLHCGVWLAPTARSSIFKLGATFSWDVLDEAPTAEGRVALEAQLRTVFSGPYEVIAQQAAVRPIINANRACMGSHPRQPRLMFFNGLASKGALRAPLAAERMAAHIVHGAALLEEEDIGVFASRCPA